MENSIPSYLQQTSGRKAEAGKGGKFTFLDRTVVNTARAVKSIYLQSESSSKDSFIQRINPHVKLVSLIYFIVIISFANYLLAQISASILIFILFIISGLRIAEVYRKIFLLGFMFGFIIIFPASLNVITPGKIVLNIFTLNKPVHFWIYDIPQNIGITDNGLIVVALVFLRVFNSIAFALLIVYTTPFPAFIKSLKITGVPDTFLMIISLAYKYFFILSRTIEETYFALKSKLSGNITNSSIRKLVGGRILFIYRRSRIIYEGTYHAMVSRGYQGDLKLARHNNLNFRDIISLVVIIVLGIVIILI